jgi:acetyl esterase/lipase
MSRYRNEMTPNGNGISSASPETFVCLPPYDSEIAASEDTQHRPIPSSLEELLELRGEELQIDENIVNDPEIVIQETQVPGGDGLIRAIVLTRKTRSNPAKPRPGVLFVHGGGRVMGNVYVGLAAVSHLVKELDAEIISVAYRLAPDFHGMAAVDDVYASLVWMSKNLSTFNIDPARFMIAGVSAGAGIAAGAILLSRDRKGPKVCAQMLVCPMLDDRCVTLSCRQFDDGRGFYTAWDRYAWKCVLGDDAGGEGVSYYVAPGRARDLSRLPPAYIDAASGEPFRDEDITYATKLWECGVQADLHIWGGGTHGFDLFTATELGAEAIKTRNAWLRRVLREKKDS